MQRQTLASHVEGKAILHGIALTKQQKSGALLEKSPKKKERLCSKKRVFERLADWSNG